MDACQKPAQPAVSSRTRTKEQSPFSPDLSHLRKIRQTRLKGLKVLILLT
jgi:hypothetical protein